MIRIRVKAAEPDEIPVKLEISMDLGALKRLVDQLPQQHPSWVLADALRDAITQFKDEMEATVEGGQS